jgi:hypothetical protein
MQRKVVDLVNRHPAQLIALAIANHRIERLERLRDNRRVRPESEIQNARVQDAKRFARNIRLLVGLTKGRSLGGLPRLASPTRNAPGAAEVAPRNTVLHEDADRGIPDYEPSRAEPTPKPLPIRTLDPRISRIALTDGRQRRRKTHRPSLPCFPPGIQRGRRRS